MYKMEMSSFLKFLVTTLIAIHVVGNASAQISRLDKRFNVKRSQQPIRKPVVRTTSQRHSDFTLETGKSNGGQSTNRNEKSITGTSSERNKLPSLSTVLSPQYRGTPVYSLENGENNEIRYQYVLTSIPGHHELLLSNDVVIITNESRSIHLNISTNKDNHISFWDARKLTYKSSFIEKRLGTFYNEIGTDGDSNFRFLFDGLQNQFYLAGFMNFNGSERADYCYAYDLESHDLETRYINHSDDNEQFVMGGFKYTIKTGFKNKRFPDRLKFTLLSKIHKLEDSEKLITDPVMHDLAYNFKISTKIAGILDVDFDSLSVKMKQQQATAGKESAELKIEDVSGIPPHERMTYDYLGSSRWLIYPKKYYGAYDAITGNITSETVAPEKNVFLYDKIQNSISPVPTSIKRAKGEHPSAQTEFTFGTSDCGKVTVNACSITRRGGGWYGPRLLDKNSPNGEKDIVFEGNAVHSTYDDEKEKLVVAYRIKTPAGVLKREFLEGDFIGSGEEVASLSSIWNKVPRSSNKSYWIAVENGYCQLFVLYDDKKTGKLVNQWKGLWTKDTSNKPVWIAEKRWLCLPTVENRWDVYSVNEQFESVQKLCSVYFGGSKKYSIVLPCGIYAGTPDCEEFMYKEDAECRIGMQALAPWRNRPAEVLEALGGNADDIAALRETTKRWLRKQGFDPDHMPAEPTLKDFPAVEVHMPNLFSTKDVAHFTVTAKATANDIAKVIVRVDGVEVPQDWSSGLNIAAGEQKELTVEVPLASGQNWIEVTPVDSQGISGDTFRFRTIYRGKAKSDLYIVALGVSDYDNPDLQLQYAAKDATDISKALEQYGSGEKHVLLLTNEQVKDRSALEKVRDFLSNTTVNDRVVFYVAGHGMLDDKYNYYYAPAGFDPDRIDETGIAMDELTACLQNAKARKKLLLLDTCHSGMLGEAGEEKLAMSGVQLPHGVRAIQHRGMKVRKTIGALNTKQKKRYIEDLFSRGDVQRGINIIAGAAGAEYALESGAWKNGVFTSTIIQALQDSNADTNKDGRLNVEELQNYVTSKVAEQTNGEQKPSSVASENGYGFILCGKGIELPAVTHTDSPSNSSYSSAGQTHEDLQPMIDRMRALKCREASSALYQKRLLTLLPMIRNGADVDITLPETKGNTALHYSCAIGSWSITQWLVEHGANVNAVTDKGSTPLDCVGEDNAERIRALLISRGAKKASELNQGGRFPQANVGESTVPEDAESLNNLGLAYQFGKGKPKDYAEAARCFRRAAEQGHAGAQNNLGFLYHNGWGVPQDYSQAAYWYRLSAQQGNAWGQSNYGTCLEFGWGVKKDVNASIEMYRRAASQGHASAKKHLKRHGITM